MMQSAKEHPLRSGRCNVMPIFLRLERVLLPGFFF
jgi:hypothetical protein